jgi:HTH-type transcriptional regulator, glycine betaine synthesis regulator
MADTAVFQQSSENLIQALGQLAENAGFNRMIGQIYALLYLSPTQLSLGEIAEKLGASKGNASLNTTSMERWGMIKRFNRPADRRDYYEADTDFWKVIRGIMRTREKKIMNDFRNSLAESLKEVKKHRGDKAGEFYEERLKHMLDFTTMFTRMLNAYVALERFNFKGLAKTGTVKGEIDEE